MNTTTLSYMPIGGYFSLEGLPEEEGILPYAPACFTQSARAALAIVLKEKAVKRIWLPRYICSVVPVLVKALGVEIAWYNISSELQPRTIRQFKGDDWMFCVNYFGLIDSKPLLERFSTGRIIFDHAQAFFQRPAPTGYTIYSPRKYFGLADGGILAGFPPLPEPHARDEQSVERFEHLLLRANGNIERGYSAFQRDESTLSDSSAKAMSTLSRRMLSCIEYEAAKKKRNENYAILHRHLGELNELKPVKDITPDGPLCYPFLSPKKIDRASLAGQGLFVPCYWREVLDDPDIRKTERAMVSNCLPLPCDHRYGEAQMHKIIQVIYKELHFSS